MGKDSPKPRRGVAERRRYNTFAVLVCNLWISVIFSVAREEKSRLSDRTLAHAEDPPPPRPLHSSSLSTILWLTCLVGRVE